VTLEIFMIGTKGYRAREAAAKLRNNRNLVSEEVRAARHAVLPDKIDQPAAEVEVPVTDETTNSTPPAATEPAATETEKVESENTETENVEGQEGSEKEPKAEEKAAGKGKNKNKK
jgi:hypothetical protein